MRIVVKRLIRRSFYRARAGLRRKMDEPRTAKRLKKLRRKFDSTVGISMGLAILLGIFLEGEFKNYVLAMRRKRQYARKAKQQTKQRRGT